MPNLRNIGTGKQLLQQVLTQTGLKTKHITKQAEVKPIKPGATPPLPTKHTKS